MHGPFFFFVDGGGGCITLNFILFSEMVGWTSACCKWCRPFYLPQTHSRQTPFTHYALLYRVVSKQQCTHAKTYWRVSLGYVIAMSLGAVLDHFANRPQQHVIALNTFFFKPTKGGAFVVEIRELKPSKFGYCVLEVTFQQPKVK